MQIKKLSDLLISVKPNTFMTFGAFVIIGIGVLSDIFSWPVLTHNLAVKIIGFTFFALGWALHLYCHKFHKKAHEVADQIQNVITVGPFSSIRHPMYLGLIMMYFGLAVGWRSIWSLLAAAVFSTLVIMTANREEEYLSDNLGAQYREYMQKVPWRFIPRVY